MEQLQDQHEHRPARRLARVALVSCARCGQLHPVEHVLAFEPVCPPCTAR